MRKVVVVIFSVIGVTVGVLATLDEGIGLSILFAGIGAVAGAAMGGAFAGVARRKSQSEYRWDSNEESFVEQDPQLQNYWLDRGRLTAAPGLPHPDDTDPHSHEP